jgi:serine/threonine-protein kinase
MGRENENWLFPVLLACAAGFICFTGLELPEQVASHFDAAGAANGHMPRSAYLVIMLVVGIGLPALATGISWITLDRPNARINLPNRDFWLAPERRAATISRLRGGILRFSAMLVTFLCYAHFLVVRANLAQPARLAQDWFVGGLVVFLVAMAGYSLAFIRRFRR